MADSSDGQFTTAYETISAEGRQVVRSPEQVALHLAIAGPASRMLAYAIDYVVILLAQVGVLALLLASSPLVERLKQPLARLLGDVARGKAEQAAAHSEVFLVIIGVFLLVQFVIESAYFVVCELLTGGRSLGKAIVGLRVVRDGGWPLTVRESLLRNLLRVVDLLPSSYVVGFLTMLVTADGKRLGDIAAGTIVVRRDLPEAAPPLEVESDEDSAFRFERAQIERLGSNERALLRQTLRRLHTLPPDRAEAVLTQTVDVLRARIGYGEVAPAERIAFLRALLRASWTR